MKKQICPTLLVSADMTKIKKGQHDCHACGSSHAAAEIAAAKNRMAKAK